MMKALTFKDHFCASAKYETPNPNLPELTDFWPGIVNSCNDEQITPSEQCLSTGKGWFTPANEGSRSGPIFQIAESPLFARI
jgi:hypothetical protein